MKYGKITAETAKLIDGLNAVTYVNAGGSVVIELPYAQPYAPGDDPFDRCAALYRTLAEKDDLFPERESRITSLFPEPPAPDPPVSSEFDLVMRSLDGSHTHNVRLANGTDLLKCNCGSVLFTVVFVEVSDHSDGVAAQCQECGQLLEIHKD